MLKSEIGLAW